MATITGKLNALNATSDIGASVDITLCGYGSRVPVSQGAGGNNGVYSNVELNVAAAPDGTFTVTLTGNDLIVPGGTYYTFTFKDGNGDILQCNAYYFLDAGSYDLANYPPYDPNQPPPPLPPLITNQLLIVTPAFDMVFDGSQYTAFKVTLPGNSNQATIENMVPGNLYTFIIVQDGAGGHLLVWPAGMHNGTDIDPEPNATTVQTFVADENGMLWAIGPGTWS